MSATLLSPALNDLQAVRLREFCLRPITPDDDQALHTLILTVLEEKGLKDMPGTAYVDPELATLSTFFAEEHRQYWVVEDTRTQQIVGGAGVGTLLGTNFREDGICEFQKAYLLPAYRRQGLGTELLRVRLAWAREEGFRYGYMETREGFDSPGLFAKFNFEPLPRKLGDNGHHAMTIFMGREL